MKISKELIDAFAEGEVEFEYNYPSLIRYSSIVNDCTLSVTKLKTTYSDIDFTMTLTYNDKSISMTNTDECKYAYYVLSRKYEEQKNDDRDNIIKTITEKVLGE